MKRSECCCSPLFQPVRFDGLVIMMIFMSSIYCQEQDLFKYEDHRVEICIKFSCGDCCRSGADVTLYESESCCGGHTLTDDSPGYPVDLGFQACAATPKPYFFGAEDSTVHT